MVWPGLVHCVGPVGRKNLGRISITAVKQRSRARETLGGTCGGKRVFFLRALLRPGMEATSELGYVNPCKANLFKLRSPTRDLTPVPQTSNETSRK